MRLITSLFFTAALCWTMTGCAPSEATKLDVKTDATADSALVKKDANPTTPTVDSHADEASRITLEEAKKDFDAGKAIFVDTRAESAYKVEHIEGAINIPAESFATRYTEVPKDKKIIAYCS